MVYANISSESLLDFLIFVELIQVCTPSASEKLDVELLRKQVTSRPPTNTGHGTLKFESDKLGT